jgi:hypothetical protein
MASSRPPRSLCPNRLSPNPSLRNRLLRLRPLSAKRLKQLPLSKARSLLRPSSQPPLFKRLCPQARCPTFPPRAHPLRRWRRQLPPLLQIRRFRRQLQSLVRNRSLRKPARKLRLRRFYSRTPIPQPSLPRGRDAARNHAVTAGVSRYRQAALCATCFISLSFPVRPAKLVLCHSQS